MATIVKNKIRKTTKQPKDPPKPIHVCAHVRDMSNRMTHLDARITKSYFAIQILFFFPMVGCFAMYKIFTIPFRKAATIRCKCRCILFSVKFSSTRISNIRTVIKLHPSVK